MNPSLSVEKKLKILFWSLTERFLSKEKTISPARIRSVLVLRPDRLGDFVLSMPALEALQKKLGPRGRLTLVAGERNVDLARFYFPRARIWTFKKNLFFRLGLGVRLWFHSFDAVIDLHSYPFSTTTALWTVLSGSPIRLGFWATGDFRQYAGVSKKVFNAGVKAPGENLSEVQKSFLLVKKLFPHAKLEPLKAGLKPLPLKTVEAVRVFYAEAGIDPRDKVLGIHPTLQKKDNRWSQKRYLELIRQLGFLKGLKIVVLHGKGEEHELGGFQKTAGRFPNVFTLPSDDLFFILEAAKRFDVLVCNDSGIMHLCAWVTKIFAVFGPSNAKRWGPQNRSGIRHQVFRAKNGLCDSVKPGQVAWSVKRELS